MKKPQGARFFVYFSSYSNQLRMMPTSHVNSCGEQGEEKVVTYGHTDEPEGVLDAAWLVDDGYGNMTLEEVDWED